MTVDITSYGADPTGVTDSTSAIMSALASGASHVIAPGGTYKISSINFFSWALPPHPSLPYFFDAASATFIHNSASTDFSMINLYSGTDTSQLLRCNFQFGFLLAQDSNVQNILYIRQCNNCRIQCALIGNGIGYPNNIATGVFVNQTNTTFTGTFNNIIEIQDITNCNNGLTIYADATGSTGFEGNQVKIGRLGFCTSNGITLGQIPNARVVFNTFNLGPIEVSPPIGQPGYALYERGGGNQFYINNLNNNGNGIGAVSGLTYKSLFIVSNESSVAPEVTTNHFYTNVYVKTTNW